MLAASYPPLASSMAKATILSPLAMAVRKSCFWASSPASAMARPDRITVVKNGLGRQARPISSRRTHRSRKLLAIPPYCSANGSPSQPSSAILRQSSGE